MRGAGGGGIASSFDNRNNSARQSKKIVVKVPTIAKLDANIVKSSETSTCKLRRHVSHNVAQSCARPARRSSLELSHSYSFNNPSSLSSSIIDSWPPLPLLSNLHIFAISTKPEDIQLDETEEDDLMIPGEIDKLPSLPIIDHRQPSSSASVVGKLSILKPPPPGLVNREESSENWSKFLENLNDILECRTGQFV